MTPPLICPPLDYVFSPLSAALMAAEARAKRTAENRFRLIVERENGLSHIEEFYLPAAEKETPAIALAIAKFILWSRGGFRFLASGPDWFTNALRGEYSAGGARAFDVDLMQRVYGIPFEVRAAAPDDFAAGASTQTRPTGGFFDGCRVGLDLGASSIKVAAVENGKEVWSGSAPWQPATNPDPRYHFAAIRAAVAQGKNHLSTLDAVGVSTAGIVIGDEVKVSSLFRAVSDADFRTSFSCRAFDNNFHDCVSNYKFRR